MANFSATKSWKIQYQQWICMFITNYGLINQMGSYWWIIDLLK